MGDGAFGKENKMQNANNLSKSNHLNTKGSILGIYRGYIWREEPDWKLGVIFMLC